MSDPSNWPGLSPGIQSRIVTINDLEMHILKASPPNSSATSAPLIVLLHGFPELAYSWRKVLVPLSEAGYHVVAPDQRGYGRTKSIHAEYPIKFEDDLTPFRMTNLVKDVVALVYTLGYQSAAAVVGHDFGASVAAFCALIRPDVFRSVVLMSSPFPGPPKLPANHASGTQVKQIEAAFAKLDPPRKHYTLYYSTPEANRDMMNAPDGLRAFLRDYYHAKSGDSEHNAPHSLKAPEAAVMAELPHYYVMRLDETMPQSVRGSRPLKQIVEGNLWLTEEELDVYVAEYTRTGFQGGLNMYRMATNPALSSDRELFYGMKIVVPAMFVAGKKDWGTYQLPGVVDVMREQACENMKDFVLIDRVGHWVQQEQSGEVVKQILRFLGKSQP
ncbi:bifunctional epoxide hydrolase 2 [Favolaschia claudopus]|uniref:Bifunctional epoxide hydrolase 2 n=1 Tax=Favolaschia claudopus TaxID=2862362 RepID=A0AAW0D1P5_9AGAR